MTDDSITLCTDSHDEERLTTKPKEAILTSDLATQVAELFKALSDPTRVRIISLLSHHELCVGDLAQILGMTQPAVSHQLRVLRNLRIVRGRKEGRHVYYSLMDEHIHDLFDQGLSHVRFG